MVLATVLPAQPTSSELHETAKTYMRNGDYDNAIIVIKKALETDPNNFELLKDLSFLYFLKRDFANAMQVGKPLIDRPDADVQCYQILGLTYKAIAEYKECRKLYKKGLAKFPESGVLYNEYGELLAMDNSLNEAIIQWEKGIQVDPNYSNNYYNAVKFYAQNNNPELFWITYFGETFVNLESYTARTTEIKKIILEAYKKMYANNNLLNVANNKKPSAFENEVLNLLNKTTNMVAQGVTVEALMATKTRFVLDWFEGSNTKFPCRLFDHYQHMLKEGIFDAYTQWLFAAAYNPAAYTEWQKQNEKQADAFKKFQTARVYKIPNNQYYK